MKNILMLFFALAAASSAHAWEVMQVKINHVQVEVNSKMVYITVDDSAKSAADKVEGQSGCAQSWGQKNWIAYKLDSTNPASAATLSVALAARASGVLVDVGSSVSGCFATNIPVSDLQYIRYGDYR